MEIIILFDNSGTPKSYRVGFSISGFNIQYKS